MKTFTNRIALFAAGAVVLGTMAYGQTMKAEIPFAFHTANATLPAGGYVINTRSISETGNTIRLVNAATHRGVYVMATQADPDRTGRSSLVFLCGSRGCSLSAIRTSRGTLTYPAPHKAAHDREAVAVISIPLTLNAD